MEYFCRAQAYILSCYLHMLDKLQKQAYRVVDPSLSAFLESLARD